LDSGELGAIKGISMSLMLPRGLIKDTDIRFNYALGGGALMDMGCEYLAYVSSLIKY
jgi:Predicted dehydrogenases and related proteins